MEVIVIFILIILFIFFAEHCGGILLAFVIGWLFVKFITSF